MLTITQAVTRSVRRTFDYASRARRSEYWWTWLFITAFIFALGLVDEMIVPAMVEADIQEYYGGGWKAWVLDWKHTPLSTGLYYLSLPTIIAVTGRRMHDVGRAAWIGISPIVMMEFVSFFPLNDLGFKLGAGQLEFNPMIGLILGLVLIIIVLGLYSFFLSLRDSDRRANRFGPSPKYHNEADVFD